MRPRAALAIAGDRRYTGRSGSDLLVAFAILVVATQLRWVVGAAWLGAVVDIGLGLRAFLHMLTRTFTVDLCFLAVGAAIVWFAGGPRRELGRAFDLACVAALPMVFVHLFAQVVVDVGSIDLPEVLRWIVESAAYGWMAALVALAVMTSRAKSTVEPVVSLPAKRAGWGVATIAMAGVAVEILWVGRHVDLVRPLEAGRPAPAFALPAIGPDGAFGARVSLVPGHITVLDFWATWCGPCLRAMPKLDQFARSHPDVDVVTINLDNPHDARVMFDQARYILKLVADDGDVSQRYGVEAIPHTVVIDRDGMLREISHGGGVDLDAAVSRLH